MSSRETSPNTLQLRLRVFCAKDNALGPGKADILESLLTTRSLNQTAKAMKMSYAKALGLVHAMNELFAEPLVAMERGGRQGGGATVTDAGQRVLAIYREMCAASESAATPGWRKLRRLLKN